MTVLNMKSKQEIFKRMEEFEFKETDNSEKEYSNKLLSGSAWSIIFDPKCNAAFNFKVI